VAAVRRSGRAAVPSGARWTMRDDFSEATRKTLAERVGYRCSNPMCGRATTRPDPRNASGSLRVGVAAHITAASPGGPRYAPDLTPQERQGIENGVWLCQNCAREIDLGPEPLSEAVLRHWRRRAEERAAGEARSTDEARARLVEDLDAASQAIRAFVAEWQQRDTPPWDWPEDFHERSSAILAASYERQGAFHQQVSPLYERAIAQAQELLGADNQHVSTRSTRRSAPRRTSSRCCASPRRWSS
jgi:hypothetical protein